MFLIGDLGWHKLAHKKVDDFNFKDNPFLKSVLDIKFSQPKWDKGIGLYGDVGVGKTNLLVLLYKNRYYWSINTKGENGFPVWISFWELVLDVKNNGMELLDSVMSDKSMVFIDDLMMRVIDWTTEKTVASLIIYKMYESDKKLCFTSNFSIDQWDIDERVKDRIIEMCEIYQVNGTSNRRVIKVE